MSKQIKTIIPKADIHGNINPPRSGAFEVTINGELIYSKLQTGNFPTTNEISNWF